MTFEKVATLLNEESFKRNHLEEISLDRPDPLMVASKYKDEFSALICALFAYGNVQAIIKFLESLDFSLLEKDEISISQTLSQHYYRFQTSQDIQQFFLTCKRAKAQSATLESIFLEGYLKSHNVMDGLRVLIAFLYDINPYRSRGYAFLLGKIPAAIPTSPYKRWHMYLRWMVRKDHLDLGLWSGVESKDLLVPLDTHTFALGKKLGLIQRKSYDFKAVLELTESFKKLDHNDPVKYDFALYRLGQERRF